MKMLSPFYKSGLMEKIEDKTRVGLFVRYNDIDENLDFLKDEIWPNNHFMSDNQKRGGNSDIEAQNYNSIQCNDQ